nr:hypothetical protein [Gordonia terrae]
MTVQMVKCCRQLHTQLQHIVGAERTVLDRCVEGGAGDGLHRETHQARVVRRQQPVAAHQMRVSEIGEHVSLAADGLRDLLVVTPMPADDLEDAPCATSGVEGVPVVTVPPVVPSGTVLTLMGVDEVSVSST